VISACQYFTCADCPTDFEPVQGNAPDTALIRGGSMIVAPFGEVLAGPLEGREGLVAANIDLKEIARGKFDLDVAGHYARPDVFGLTVDLAPKSALFTEKAEQSLASTSPELTQATRLRG
jgi:nitrilase